MSEIPLPFTPTQEVISWTTETIPLAPLYPPHLMPAPVGWNITARRLASDGAYIYALLTSVNPANSDANVGIDTTASFLVKIDAHTKQRVGFIPVRKYPADLVIDPIRQHAYVSASEDVTYGNGTVGLLQQNVISVIDTRSCTLLNEYKVDPGFGLSALTVNPLSGLVYGAGGSANSNNVIYVFNPDGTLHGPKPSVPSITWGWPFSDEFHWEIGQLVIDESTDTVYAPGTRQTAVFSGAHPDQYRLIDIQHENIFSAVWAFNASSNRMYALAAPYAGYSTSDRMMILDGATLQPIGDASPLDYQVQWLAIDRELNRVYVETESNMYVITDNTGKNKPHDQIPMPVSKPGTRPSFAAINPVTHQVYVSFASPEGTLDIMTPHFGPTFLHL